MDTWASAMLLLMACAVHVIVPGKIQIPSLSAILGALGVVVWLQYGAGLIQFAGIAWTSTAYLLGFALAIMVGQRWEKHQPMQLGDGLFAAVLIAAVLSVGLQLHQWLQLDVMDIWSMGGVGTRLYANFGQPNQLATLLLWGILGMWWLCLRKYLRPGIAVLGTIFLAWGVVLTASRAAWIGVFWIAVGAGAWSRHWPWRHARIGALTLVACFIALSVLAPAVTDLLLLPSMESPSEVAFRGSGDLRMQAWWMFLDALWASPWWGYGWTQGIMAQLVVADAHPSLQILFQYAHNLFLDLLLWCGIPLGLALSAFLVVWAWRRLRAVRDASSAILFLMIVVIASHSMLEFPLYYAYFLLPVGLVIGALETRLGMTSALSMDSRSLGWILCVVCGLMLAGIARDYLRIEAAYQALRFEQANFRINAPRVAPEVLMLDQLRGPIALARLEPTRENASEHVDWMRRVAWTYPNAGTIHKFAASLAWTGHPEEAAVWLRRMCAVVVPRECDAVRQAWVQQAHSDLAIATVRWPN